MNYEQINMGSYHLHVINTKKFKTITIDVNFRRKVVKEEITNLNVWGQHPRYQKEPMTTPANKEVMAGTADRDFNDDSAKGDEPYGKKIGDGKPFDQKVVNMLVDQVMSKIKNAQ